MKKTKQDHSSRISLCGTNTRIPIMLGWGKRDTRNLLYLRNAAAKSYPKKLGTQHPVAFFPSKVIKLSFVSSMIDDYTTFPHQKGRRKGSIWLYVLLCILKRSVVS